MAVCGLDSSFTKKLNHQITRGLSPHLKQMTKDSGKQEGDFQLRTFDFQVIFEDGENKIRRLSIGKPNELRYTVSVLLVGATGAGKSALVNTLINQAYGVQFQDSFRLKLVEKDCEKKEGQNVSQTDWITIYQFNNQRWMPIDFNLVIIDTPGLGDTRGLAFDKKMFERMEILFKTEAFGVDELNCIGLVTPSSEARLTDKQMYIFDGCMRIFGRDVKDIIHIMATFSDGSDPKVLNALNAAGVEYHELHKFNNSSIFLPNTTGSKNALNINELHWEEMEECTSHFFEYLQGSTSKSLTLTPGVLENRRILNEKCRVLEQKLQLILSKVYNFKEMQKAMERNQNSDMKVTVLEPFKEQYEKKALNCCACNVTCHKPCPTNCKICKEMKHSGNVISCRVCKCSFVAHERESYHFKIVWKQDMKKVDKKYKQQVKEESDKTTKELIDCLREVKKCVETLKSIALRSNQMSLENYIGNLIEEEKEIDGNSYSQKVSMLQCIQQAEKMSTSSLNNDDQLVELLNRLELADKTQINKQRECCVM
ncbi:unnamed protein product [Meganyctiphanes norvegica]|uniref:AIG1-type G domain-containing protein n=1 Tax=Meganyctiphanes norvegica TaxID=48144 RepID=A0AAV2R4X8_MEGNR